MITFSLIVPVYNSENYIEKTIYSLLDLNYNSYEIIFVNDGSSDNSSIVLEKFKNNPKIKVITKSNGGVFSARNAGLSVAEGEYILFADQDDTLHKDAMAYYNKAIEENEKPDIICGNADIFENQATKPYIVTEPFLQNKLIDKTQILSHLFYPMASSFFKEKSDKQAQNILSVVWNKAFKKTFLEKNKLNFQMPLAFEDDHNFCLACFSKANTVYFLNKVVYTWIVRKNSTSHTWNKIIDFWEKVTYLNNYYFDFIIKDIELDKNSRKKLMSAKWLWSIKAFIGNEMYDNSSNTERIRQLKKIDIRLIEDLCVLKGPKDIFIYICIKTRMYRLLLYVLCRVGLK